MEPHNLKIRYQRLLDDYHSGAINWQTFERGLFELKRIRAALASSEDTDLTTIPNTSRIEKIRREADTGHSNRFVEDGNEQDGKAPTTRRRKPKVALSMSTVPASSFRAEPKLPTGEESGIEHTDSKVLKATPLRPQIGSVLGGRYTLQRSLGQGTLGETWQARDEKMEACVVIKQVPLPIRHDSKALRRLIDAFRRAEALKHPNICPVYYLDEDEKLGSFIVTAYLDAVTLDDYRSQYIQTYRAFPVPAAVRVLWPIATAIDYAGKHKTFHGALKPENVMVGKACGVVTTDFGLAETARMSLWELGVPINASAGSAWRAPEVWLDGRYGALSDQFSLAVLAYQLLAGELPFSGRNESDIREKIIYALPPQIESESDTVNAALQQGLAKDPFDRFPSCLHFVKALIEPIVAQGRKPDARPGLIAFLFGTPPPEVPACVTSESIWPAELGTACSPDLNIPQQAVYPYPGTKMEAPPSAVYSSSWLTGTMAMGLGGLATISVAGGILATTWLGSANEAEPPSDVFPLETVTLLAEPHAAAISADDLRQLAVLAVDGDVDAQRKLGECFYLGHGVESNHLMAVRYFQQAAEENDVLSLYYLGRCYELGHGLATDINTAKSYYSRAAQYGSQAAQAALRRLDD